MIVPTVGRIVWFFHDDDSGIERAAIITRVYGDRMINVCVFDDSGATPYSSVPLVQPEDDNLVGESHCSWMPYQTKKASGSESGEKGAGSQAI